MKSDVFVVNSAPVYPAAPYDEPNSVDAAVDSLLFLWGRDVSNPFGEWVAPGGVVVIKPNWVHHDQPGFSDLDALVTHSSVIKRILDHVATALDGKGTVVIGDAPIQSCDFQRMVARTGIADVVERVRRAYPSLNIVVEDWRLTVLDEDAARLTRHSPDAHEAYADFRLVDLGSSSFLEDLSDYADRFRVTCYPADLMGAHHRRGTHEYLVTRRVFDADLVINVPKMKTHIKAGLTGALKNLVGINGHKEFLPHHILGSSEAGGDCYYKQHRLRDVYESAYDKFWAAYPDLSVSRRKLGSRALAALWRLSEMLTGDSTATGSWAGNETVWRMTLDLNHLLYFGTSARVITIVDGIVAGESEGPLRPEPKAAGLIVGGENPAYIDCVLARLMGYNVARVPTAYNAVFHRKSKFAGPDLDEVVIKAVADQTVRTLRFHELPNLNFVKPKHWTRAATPGHVAVADMEPIG